MSSMLRLLIVFEGFELQLLIFVFIAIRNCVFFFFVCYCYCCNNQYIYLNSFFFIYVLIVEIVAIYFRLVRANSIRNLYDQIFVFCCCLIDTNIKVLSYSNVNPILTLNKEIVLVDILIRSKRLTCKSGWSLNYLTLSSQLREKFRDIFSLSLSLWFSLFFVWFSTTNFRIFFDIFFTYYNISLRRKIWKNKNKRLEHFIYFESSKV